MKHLLKAVLLVWSAATFMIADAEAKGRVGGGKSTGMQREIAKPATPAAPAQNTVAPAKPAAPVAAPAAPAPAPSGTSRWLGPLAGLAAGGLLASLFMGGGFGGIKMFDILLIAGLAFAAFMIFRMMRRPAVEGAGAPMPYAGNTASDAPAPVSGRVMAPEIGSKLADGNASPAEIEAATVAPRIPAGFEVEPFLRQGRLAFIRLQDANDRGDTNEIRDFTTPEMYAELSLQVQERGGVAQRTEVVKLDVHLLEVVTEGRREIASVRFVGEIREAANEPVAAFDEVWHVTKNTDDPKATWLLAGIQQLA